MSYNAYDKDNDEIVKLADGFPAVDAVPTEGSTRPVSSGGVYDSIDDVMELTEDKTNKATQFAIVGQTQFDINTPDTFAGFLMLGSYDSPSSSTSGFGLYYIRKSHTNVGYKAIAAYSRLQSISSSSNTSITVSLTQQTNIQGELFILWQ